MDNTYHFSVTAIFNGNKESQRGLVIAPNLASAVQRVTNRFSYCELVGLNIKRKSEDVELFLYGDGFQTKGEIQNEVIENKTQDGKTEFVSNLNTCCGGGSCHCHDTKKMIKKPDRTNVRIEADNQLDKQFADLTSLLDSLLSN
jgi:hypothetical protein